MVDSGYMKHLTTLKGIKMKNDVVNYKFIKSIVEKATGLDKNFSMVLDARKQEIQNIKNAAEMHYNQNFKYALKAISVDEMSRVKKGITVEYLKKAGITNMYALSEMRYIQIRHVEGIGPKNAKLINEYKKKIIEEVKDVVSMRLNANDPSEIEFSLIRAICIFLCHEDIREKVKPVYKGYHEELLKNIAITEEIDSN